MEVPPHLARLTGLIRTPSRVFPYPRGVETAAMVGLWSVGGLLAIVAALLPGTDLAERGPLLVVGLLAMVIGGVTHLARARLPRWVPAASCALGTMAVSVVIASLDDEAASAAFALLYGWVILFAVVFLSARMAVVQIALVMVGAGLAFSATDDELRPIVPVVMTGGVGVLCAGVAWLARARELTEVDPLTRTANARHLERLLTRELDRSRSSRAPLCAALLDLDHFAAVNEREGTEEGDRLLVEVTGAWRGHLRPTDHLGRIGGDGFLLIFPRTDLDEAQRVVDRLRAATPRLTVSGGLAAPAKSDTAAMLLRRVEAALFEAKRGGRDRVAVSGVVDAAARELELAIEREELVTHFQPTVDLRTGRVTSVEALVRWDNPVRGLLPPVAFIGLAEQTGLIVPLGAWVLEDACRRARGWLDDYPSERLHVAVNVSHRQLDEPSFVETVADVLERTGLPPELLVLEVTETMLGADEAGVLERLVALRDLGIEVAMDDFGTGYSALHQLRRLPVGMMKVDRSFVEDVGLTTEADALIAAVVGIGRGLGRAVMAEGVETLEHLNLVRRLGCDSAQGFLLGRPLPPESIPRLLDRQRRSGEISLAQADLEVRPRSADPPPRLVSEDVARWVDADRPLNTWIRPLLRHLLEASGLESAYLTRIDWEGGHQHVLRVERAGDLEIQEGTIIALSETVCRRALNEGVHRTDDVQRQFPGLAAAAQLGLHAYATAPVVLLDGTVFGTLCVAGTTSERISDETMGLLCLYSRLIADRVASEPWARADA